MPCSRMPTVTILHSWFKQTPAKVVIEASVASLAVLSIAAAGIVNAHTTVLVSVQGVVRPVSTWDASVRGVINATGVEVGPDDVVKVDAVTALPDSVRRVPTDAELEIFRGRPVDLQVAGKTTTVVSAAQTVEELLAESAQDSSATVNMSRGQVLAAGLPVATDNTVIPVTEESPKGREQTKVELPASTATIEDALASTGVEVTNLDEVRFQQAADGELEVELIRVSRSIETTTTDVAFPKDEKPATEMFVGESVMTAKGEPGVQERSERIEQRGLSEPTAQLLSEEVTKQPVAQVTEVGKKEVTPLALIEAGLDPKAELVTKTDDEGKTSVRFEGKLGTITPAVEIAKIRGDIPEGTTQVPEVYSGEDPRAIAQTLVEERGWSAEFTCLLNLWDRESGWNPYAENPSSGAYGIPQALPGSKMASVADDWRTNPRTQIIWGLDYIGGRYGTPCGAWNFFTANNYY